MENSIEAPQKTNTANHSDAAPGHIPKGMKLRIQRDTCAPIVIAALFTIAKLCKQPR
jgi:hypothetical protein